MNLFWWRGHRFGDFRRCVVLAWGAALILLCAAPSLAETRIALVIGNSDYVTQKLSNPANDANLMSKSLEKVGFQVITEIDADGRAMKRAVHRFGRALRDAGEGAVGFVYYAGHGIQAKGENYMIPIDAQIEDSLDVEFEGFPASTLLSALESAGNRLNIVVMDACRNNPYESATRSGGGGLARMDAPSGTLIAYSTSPGKVAADGRGRNSPYTHALARSIETPGATVEQVFKSVRVAVMDRTNGAQVPWESSSLTGDFFFKDAEPEPVAAPEPAAEPQVDDATLELTFWDSIKDGESRALFESYLARYPDGVFAGLAKAKIAEIANRQSRQSDTAFFQAIQNSTSKADFEAYLAQFPNGTFAGLAKARITAIEKENERAIAAASLESDATTDPDSEFWSQVQNSKTTAELQAYIDQFPEGQYVAIARAKIAGIEERRQVAALTPTPAREGTRSFSGTLVREGTGYGGSFCSGGADETFPTQLTVEKDKVLVVMQGITAVTAKNKQGKFSTTKYIAGVSGSEPFRLQGSYSGTTATVKFGRGRCSFTGNLALDTAGHIADGRWEITWLVEGGRKPQVGFCSPGEVAQKIVSVRDGEFETRISSDRSSGYMRGQFAGQEQLLVRFHSVAWQRKNAKLDIPLSGGRGEAIRQGRNCGPHVISARKID